MGPQPDLLERLRDADAAIARALDLSAPPAPAPTLPVPQSLDEARVPLDIAPVIAGWLDRMRSGERLVEERLVWFWHDHFATGIQKVRIPYLMLQQHLTVRRHATGNFAEMLHAIATDPAMLLYLDGVTNSSTARNENFGREVMELFTVGHGEYTQDDVVSSARAFSGWQVMFPGRRVPTPTAPWAPYFTPARFDAGVKTLLGTTGPLDAGAACDVLLGHPTTAARIAAKLFAEIVGIDPDARTARRLGDRFRRDWDIPALVEAIVSTRAFLADEAVGARVRTPIEKLVAILQAPASPPPVVLGTPGGRGVWDALTRLGYLPFAPPRVDGFPKGRQLLGPNRLVHSLDLLAALDRAPEAAGDVDALLARFGLVDVARAMRNALDFEHDPGRRVALVVASPELAVT
jgi:uncharacterized protein (DUF1800 family)